MAIPTPVNGQITDAVTQVNVQVQGSAPAQALGAALQVHAQALGLAAHNAVLAQQQMNTLSMAVAGACVDHLLKARSV